MGDNNATIADLMIIRESIQDFQISSAIEQNNLDAQKMHEHYMTFNDEALKARYATILRQKWIETTNNLNGDYKDITDEVKYPKGSATRESAVQSNNSLKAHVQLFDTLLADETPGVGQHTYGTQRTGTHNKSAGDEFNAADAVAWMAFGGLSGFELPSEDTSKTLRATADGVDLWTSLDTTSATYNFVDTRALANAKGKVNIDSSLARIVALYALWYKHGVVTTPIRSPQADGVDQITIKHFQILASGDTDQKDSTYGTCTRYGYCEILTTDVSAQTYKIFTNDVSGMHFFATMVGAMLAYKNLVGGASRTPFFGGEAEFTSGMFNAALENSYQDHNTNGWLASDIKVVFRNIGGVSHDMSVSALNLLHRNKLDELSDLNIHFTTNNYVEPAHEDRTASAGSTQTSSTQLTSADTKATANGYGHANITAGTMTQVLGTKVVINASSNTATNGALSTNPSPFLKTILDPNCLFAEEALKKLFGNDDELDIDLRKVGLAVEIGALKANGQLIDDKGTSATSAWYRGFDTGLTYLNRARVAMGKTGDLTWEDIIKMNEDGSSSGYKQLGSNFVNSTLKLKKWGPGVAAGSTSEAPLSTLGNSETIAEDIFYLPKRDDLIASDNEDAVKDALFLLGSGPKADNTPIKAHLWANAVKDLVKQALVSNPAKFESTVSAVARLMKSTSGSTELKSQLIYMFNKNGSSGQFGGASGNDDTRGPIFTKAQGIDFVESSKSQDHSWVLSMIFLHVVAQLNEAERGTLYVKANFEKIGANIANLVKFKSSTTTDGNDNLVGKFVGINVTSAAVGSETAHYKAKEAVSAGQSAAIGQPFPKVAGTDGYSAITGQFDNSWFVKTRDLDKTLGTAGDYKVNRELVEVVFSEIQKLAQVSNNIMGRLKVVNNTHLTLSELMDIRTGSEIKDFNDGNAIDFSSDGFAPSNDSLVTFNSDCQFAVKAIFHVMKDKETDGIVDLLTSDSKAIAVSNTDNNKLHKVARELGAILDDNSLEEMPECVYAFFYNLKAKAARSAGQTASETAVVKKSATMLNAIAEDMSVGNNKVKGLFENNWSTTLTEANVIKSNKAQVEVVSDILRRTIFPAGDLATYGALDLDTTSYQNIRDALSAEEEFTRIAQALKRAGYTPQNLYEKVYAEDSSLTNYGLSNESNTNNHHTTIYHSLVVYLACEVYGHREDYVDQNGMMMPGGLTKAALDELLGKNLITKENLQGVSYLAEEMTVGSNRAFKKEVTAYSFVHYFVEEVNGREQKSIGYGVEFNKDNEEVIAQWEA